MADSASPGLIVFLPLVGAILGAVVGGFVGAYANGRARDRATKKAEDRELLGLLRLIDLEIFNNNKLLHDDEEDQISLFGVLAIGRLRTENWDRLAARLTQLLSPLNVYTLAVYYSLIADIQAATESPATPRNDDIAALLNEQASRAIELGNAARWSINHEYIKEADRLLPVPEPPGQSGNEEGAATDRL